MFRVSLFMAAGALAAAALAAGEITYKNELGVYMTTFVVEGPSPYYERYIAGPLAVTGGFAFARVGHTFADADPAVELTGWYYDVNAGVKIYPVGDFRRFYLTAGLHYTFEDLEDTATGEPANVTRVIPAATVGWKWVIFDRLSLGIGAGAGYVAAGRKSGPGTAEIDYGDVIPRFDFSLGFWL